MWGFCFWSLIPASFSSSSVASSVVPFPQLILHHLSHKTHLIQLYFHNLSSTTHLTPLISHNSSHTTSLTHLISHNSSHTPQLTPLISHNSSQTSSLTQLISYNSSHTTAQLFTSHVRHALHWCCFCVAGAALREPGRCLWLTVAAGPRIFLCDRYSTRCTGCCFWVAGAALREPGRCVR